MKLEIVLLLQAGLAVPEVARRTNASPANVRWYRRELAKAQARLYANSGKHTKHWQKA